MLRNRWMVGPLSLLLAASGCGRDVAEAEDSVVAMAPRVEGLDPNLQLPEGVTWDLVEEGRQLYPVCLVCHGEDATGTPLGPSLRDAEWIHITGTVEEIEQVIRSGVPNPSRYPVPMPVMGGGAFDEQQLRALAIYIHLLGQAGV